MISKEGSSVPVPNDPMEEMQEKFDSMTLPEDHGERSAHGSEENGRNLLLNMPKRPLIDIFSYCDFVSVQSLRKTCHSIREFIDNQHIDPNFTFLGFKFAEDNIELTLRPNPNLIDDRMIISYKKVENDTTIIRKKNEITHEKIIRDSNFVDLFLQDFRVLTEKSKFIPVMCFDFRTENFLANLLGNFQDIMKIRNFRTDRLHFDVYDSSQIIAILPLFDPNFLNLLRINGPQLRRRRLLRLKEIEKLEQWKQLEFVVIEDFFHVNGPRRFKHLNQCRVYFKTFNRSDLVLLMKTYLNSTSFSLMMLTFAESDVDVSELYNVLGDHGFGENDDDLNGRTRWFFRHPKGVLEVAIQRFYKHVDFEIQQPENVPPGAIIRERFFSYNMIEAFFAEMISDDEPVPVPKDPMKEMQEKFDDMTIPEEHGEHSAHGSEEKGRNLLLNMPEGPLLDIFSYCDFVSVQSLRKSCLSIREFIDDQRIDPHFECLGFKFAEDSIELFLYSELFDTETELTYKKTENSTTLIRKTNEITHEKIIRDANFIDLFCQDFLVLTKSSKQIPYIFFTIKTDNLLESLFEKFQEILKLRNFKTSKLVFHVRDSAHILSILPFFDPNFLKTLYVQDSGTDQRSILNLTEVAKLEQWRRLENVHIEFFEAERPMTFKDFNLLRIQPELTWTFR